MLSNLAFHSKFPINKVNTAKVFRVKCFLRKTSNSKYNAILK